MKSYFQIRALFLPVVISSCVSSVNSATTASDVNKTITVTAPAQINTFKLDDFVGIAVENNSDHEVLLSPEGSIEITVTSEGQPRNVRNSLNSSNREILLSPQSQKYTNQTLFGVIPDIKEQGKITVRITVKGKDQTTNQDVSAYVDLILSP